MSSCTKKINIVDTQFANWMQTYLIHHRSTQFIQEATHTTHTGLTDCTEAA